MKRFLASLGMALTGALTVGMLPMSTAWAVPACDGTFSYSGAEATCLVTTTGDYTITAYGAQGGGATYYRTLGGRGAAASGVFHLTTGAVLDLYVGGAGQDALAYGGGGGGTFVVLDASGPVLIVGGGGGGAYDSNGQAASLTANGTDATLSQGTPGGTGGVNGQGGAAVTSSGGGSGAGGGILSDGGSGRGTGGHGLTGTPVLAGGASNTSDGGRGGFGGGGGAKAGSGAGGGYSGGGGTSSFGGLGGGGGSYIDTGVLDGFVGGATIALGSLSGNGQIVIAEAAPMPEPGTLALSLLPMFLALGARRRLSSAGRAAG